jgi:hypothetical protein
VNHWLYGDDVDPNCVATVSLSCVDHFLRERPARKFYTFVSVAGGGQACYEGIKIGQVGGWVGAGAGCVAGLLAFEIMIRGMERKLVG